MYTLSVSGKWSTLATKYGYLHPFFKVREDTVQLPNGSVIPDFTVWESGDVAQVVPITSDGKYLLVQQYKHGLGAEIIEFPGGFVDPGEDPKEAALRELSEETGYSTNTLIKLGTFSHHPTKESGKLHLYLAKKVQAQTKKLKADETEVITLLYLTKEEIFALITSQTVLQTGTILGFLMSLQNIDE